MQLIGNLGEAPKVLKETQSGSFVSLSLATNKKYTNDKGEAVQDTQWHTVYLNNGIGKYAASYLKKGDKVLVLGELRKHQWKDKEGKTQFTVGVFAKECRAFVVKPRENDGEEERSVDEELA